VDANSCCRVNPKRVLGDPLVFTNSLLGNDALKQALAVELEQSPFLNVLSDRKVSETFRMMGRPAEISIIDQHFKRLEPVLCVRKTLVSYWSGVSY
jgi:hypothetical protein